MNRNSIGFIQSSTTTTQTTILDSFLHALTKNDSKKEREHLEVYDKMKFSDASKAGNKDQDSSQPSSQECKK